ncbi:MAG: hypothetical protein VB853_05310 [Pirellulales bacterium]
MADTATNSIEQKLKQAWRQERRFYNVRGFSRFVVWLIVMIVLDFVIDWGIMFKTRMTFNMSLLLLIINIGVLAWVLWHEWLRYLKPFNPLMVALEVEGRHPELSSVLVSYTQLDGLTVNQPNVSAELIDAMRDQAVMQTRPLDFREIVDFGQLKQLFLVAVGVLVFFAAISFQWQQEVGILFKRLVGIDVSYPTDTQIVKATSSVTVQVGDSVDVMAEVEGLIPQQGQIYKRPAGSDADWSPLPMHSVQNQPSVFRRQLKDLATDQEFYVSINDDRSDIRRITVVQSPRVVNTQVELNYPAYMNRAAGESDQLTLEVHEGTKIQWLLKCEPAVKRVQVKMGKTSFDADIDETGQNVSFDVTADESVKYTFRWTERGSGKDFVYDGVQHSIRVVADALPEINLKSPSGGGMATVDKKVSLEASASDDHGLSKAWLEYSVDNNPEYKRVDIRNFKGVRSVEKFAYPWTLGESVEDLKPGMQITFRIVVDDLHPASAHRVRRSAERHLSIVEPERYLQWYRGELAAQTAAIKRARDAETVSSIKVKQIKVQEGVDE